jgi:hypothetical protein
MSKTLKTILMSLVAVCMLVILSPGSKVLADKMMIYDNETKKFTGTFETSEEEMRIELYADTENESQIRLTAGDTDGFLTDEIYFTEKQGKTEIRLLGKAPVDDYPGISCYIMAVSAPAGKTSWTVTTDYTEDFAVLFVEKAALQSGSEETVSTTEPEELLTYFVNANNTTLTVGDLEKVAKAQIHIFNPLPYKDKEYVRAAKIDPYMPLLKFIMWVGILSTLGLAVMYLRTRRKRDKLSGEEYVKAQNERVAKKKENESVLLKKIMGDALSKYDDIDDDEDEGEDYESNREHEPEVREEAGRDERTGGESEPDPEIIGERELCDRDSESYQEDSEADSSLGETQKRTESEDVRSGEEIEESVSVNKENTELEHQTEASKEKEAHVKSRPVQKTRSVRPEEKKRTPAFLSKANDVRPGSRNGDPMPKMVPRFMRNS